MISKNIIKQISQLKQKKYRGQHQLFVAEGEKSIQELLDAQLVVKYLCVAEEQLFPHAPNKFIVSDQDLKKMSNLSSPPNCLAVFEIPTPKKLDHSSVILALDKVRDPGNLGTIIRLCDWFGIAHIVCSPDTVDTYNPKVVQATMGSLARVDVHYTPLADFFSTYTGDIVGTFMQGENIYKTQWKQPLCIVLGNEANGISPEIEALITKKITIPRFGNLQQTESLNVSMATAIVLSECVSKL